MVFHWDDIIKKVLSKACGSEKRWKGGDGQIGEVAHRREGAQTFCTLWKCIFQHFRWVEDQKVSERILEIWPSVIKIMNHWMFLPPSKQPKCKSVEVVKGAIKDPFTVAKLKFFSSIAGLLQSYLTIYQPQKPLIPFLYDDLQSFIAQ